ncbi:MAG: hypothetical protein AB7J40_01220 [Candidatus Altimarinota bacterium]
MTHFWKLIGFGKGLFVVLKNERQVKDEIDQKGLEKFLEEHKFYSSGKGEAVAK